MMVIVLSFVVFVLAFTGMAIGVLLHRRGIRPCNAAATSVDGETPNCEGCSLFRRQCDVSPDKQETSKGKV